jgi:hypothetical protein
MNVDTASEILTQHHKLNQWSQRIPFDVGGEVIDLSLYCVDNPPQPPNIKGSTTSLPNNTTFLFDDSKYKGEDSRKVLMNDLKSACVGCSLQWRKGHVADNQTAYVLRCDHYRVPDARWGAVFEGKNFSKSGSTVELNKQRGSSSAFKRMPDYKLRNKSPLELSPKVTVNEKNKATRRTSGSVAVSQETRCKMCIRLTRYHTSGCWYLATGSNVDHKFHLPIRPEVTKLSECNLNNEEVDLMKLLYNNGVGVASMGKIMTSLSKKRNVKGLFLTQTVRNMTARLQSTMNHVSGIDPKWTVAQKTIHSMNE